MTMLGMFYKDILSTIKRVGIAIGVVHVSFLLFSENFI